MGSIINETANSTAFVPIFLFWSLATVAFLVVISGLSCLIYYMIAWIARLIAGPTNHQLQRDWQQKLDRCSTWLTRLHKLLVEHNLGDDHLHNQIKAGLALAEELAGDSIDEDRLDQLKLLVLNIRSTYRAWVTRNSARPADSKTVLALEQCLYQVGLIISQ